MDLTSEKTIVSVTEVILNPKQILRVGLTDDNVISRQDILVYTVHIYSVHVSQT